MGLQSQNQHWLIFTFCPSQRGCCQIMSLLPIECLYNSSVRFYPYCQYSCSCPDNFPLQFLLYLAQYLPGSSPAYAKNHCQTHIPCMLSDPDTSFYKALHCIQIPSQLKSMLLILMLMSLHRSLCITATLQFSISADSDLQLSLLHVFIHQHPFGFGSALCQLHFPPSTLCFLLTLQVYIQQRETNLVLLYSNVQWC